MLASPPNPSQQLPDSLAAIWQSLGIGQEILQQKNLCIFEEASQLVDVEQAEDGRIWQLIPAAAQAWHQLQQAAALDGITLRIASAYRPSSRQAELISRKLAQGQQIKEILQVLAPPGCSEHHTGRAVDIYMPGGPIVEEAFETTIAFTWLSNHAASHGFSLSFPRGNPFGYLYEPWHWCFHAT